MTWESTVTMKSETATGSTPRGMINQDYFEMKYANLYYLKVMIILLIWYLLKKVLEAANGKVTFLNNSGRSVKIKTYNENDILHWVPYQTLTVAPDDVVRLQARGENFLR